MRTGAGTPWTLVLCEEDAAFVRYVVRGRVINFRRLSDNNLLVSHGISGN